MHTAAPRPAVISSGSPCLCAALALTIHSTVQTCLPLSACRSCKREVALGQQLHRGAPSPRQLWHALCLKVQYIAHWGALMRLLQVSAPQKPRSQAGRQLHAATQEGCHQAQTGRSLKGESLCACCRPYCPTLSGCRGLTTVSWCACFNSPRSFMASTSSVRRSLW